MCYQWSLKRHANCSCSKLWPTIKNIYSITISVTHALKRRVLDMGLNQEKSFHNIIIIILVSNSLYNHEYRQEMFHQFHFSKFFIQLIIWKLVQTLNQIQNYLYIYIKTVNGNAVMGNVRCLYIKGKCVYHEKYKEHFQNILFHLANHTHHTM